MDERRREQVINKPPKQVIQDGTETLAKAKGDWVSLPQETREQLLIKSVDCAQVASYFPLSKALLMMFKVGYYYGKRNGLD